MFDYENSVAEVDMTTEMPADDAQAAEITAEDVLRTLANDGADETAVNEGDGGPESAQDEGENSTDKAKFDARIKAALASQRKKYEGDVNFAGRMRGIADGMTDEEIYEAFEAHQARKMHENDADISEKAAREIIRARQSRNTAQSRQVDAYKKGIESLMEDGWSADELRAFASDETVRSDLDAGKTLRQAATAYLRRARDERAETPAGRKRGVPTMTRAASGNVGRDRIAEMSDKEFEEFQRSVSRRALAGEKIRL